jgi:hypothetical protein
VTATDGHPVAQRVCEAIHRPEDLQQFCDNPSLALPLCHLGHQRLQRSDDSAGCDKNDKYDK